MQINHWFMSQCAVVAIWSTRKVLESTKDREGDSRVTESNSSLLSALQTSQVLHISTYAQMFHNIFNAAVNLKFITITIACAQSSARQCLVDYLLFLFFKFFFKLRESLQRSLKITFKKVLESILSRKTCNSPKNSSWTKKLIDLRTPYLAQMTTTTFAYYLLTNSNESVSL